MKVVGLMWEAVMYAANDLAAASAASSFNGVTGRLRDWKISRACFCCESG
jgi:hypothetical protein